MTVARLQISEGQLSWVGVGNVEAALFRGAHTAGPSFQIENRPWAGVLGTPYQRATLLGGVVGYKLPQARAGTLDLFAGDLLVFATDGIDVKFTEGLADGGHPQQIADRILDNHFKGTDDALVLVVRYCEASSGSSIA